MTSSTGSAEGTDLVWRWFYELCNQWSDEYEPKASWEKQVNDCLHNLESALRNALAASPPTTLPSSGEDALYRPTLIRNEEAGFVEFVTEDAPAITGHMFTANVEPIVRMASPRGEVLGYRIYDPAPTPVPEGREALREALEDSQSLLVAMLHEARPATEIEAQIVANRDALSSPVSGSAAEVVGFDAWWSEDGQYIDPDTSDVPWFDKRRGLAEAAFNAGRKA